MRKRSNKHASVIALILALGLFATACGGGGSSPSTSTPGSGGAPVANVGDPNANEGNSAPKQVGKIKDGILTCKTDCAFQFMAQEQGFFDDYGVEVEFVQNNSNVTLLKALIAGELDVIEVTPDGALAAVEQGNGLKIIGGSIPGLPHVLYARDDIKTVEDLKGRSAGTSQPGALPQVVVMSLAEKAGMNGLTDIQWVNVGGESQRVQALLAGKIDATAAAADFIPMVEEQDGYHVAFSFRDTLPEYLRFVYITTDKVIQEKGEALQAFMTASSKGLRYAVENPEETVELAKKILNTDDDTNIRSSMGILIGQKLVAPDLAVTPEQVNFMQEINISLDKQQKLLPIDQVLDLSFQEKALAELGPWEWK